MLAIFAPMAFPSERLGTPLSADVMPTNSSGKLVASPIISDERMNPPSLVFRASDLRWTAKTSEDFKRTSEKTMMPRMERYSI